jgi:hypothetical protein
MVSAAISLAVFVSLSPWFINERVDRVCLRLPFAGMVLHRLLISLIDFRSQKAKLCLAGTLALAVHLGVVGVMYLLGIGLAVPLASFSSFIAIVPLSSLVLLIPLPFNGLGALELTFSYLYKEIGGCEYGLLIILGYRAIFILTLAVSTVVFALRDADADRALHEAEELDDAG